MRGEPHDFDTMNLEQVANKVLPTSRRQSFPRFLGRQDDSSPLEDENEWAVHGKAHSFFTCIGTMNLLSNDKLQED